MFSLGYSTAMAAEEEDFRHGMELAGDLPVHDIQESEPDLET